MKITKRLNLISLLPGFFSICCVFFGGCEKGNLSDEKVVCEFAAKIYLFNADQNSMKVLLPTPEEGGAENPVAVKYSQPSLSPDENHLVYKDTFAAKESGSVKDFDELMILDLKKKRYRYRCQFADEKAIGDTLWFVFLFFLTDGPNLKK